MLFRGTEPVSAAPPQLPESLKLDLMTRRAGRPISLTCPGQGQPPPTFRYWAAGVGSVVRELSVYLRMGHGEIHDRLS